jgi:hypothetical protein
VPFAVRFDAMRGNCGMGSRSLNAEVNALEETPHRSRPEFLVLRLEVQVMHGSGEVLGASSLPSTKAS